MNRLFKWAIPAVAGLALVESVHALDLSGAWATNADQCSQVFVRKGRSNQVGFTALSEQYGGGFIVEADRLRGKFASCKMKSRKEDGHIVNIIAGLCDRDHAFQRPIQPEGA
jgi:hypothetical protein